MDTYQFINSTNADNEYLSLYDGALMTHLSLLMRDEERLQDVHRTTIAIDAMKNLQPMLRQTWSQDFP